MLIRSLEFLSILYCILLYHQLNLIMVNKCVVYGCKYTYVTKCIDEKEDVHTFHFPFTNPELLKAWNRFVNRHDWKPTENSVICHHHFDDSLIIKGKKKWSLKLNSVPTILIKNETFQTPSVLPTIQTSRKPPKIRIYREDELESFLENDVIHSLDDLNENHAPANFQFKRSHEYVLYYNLVFDETTNFPKVHEAIKIDSELHVQLQYKGIPVPLPKFFVQGYCARMTRISMLENFPSEIRRVAEENKYSILDEINEKKWYRPQGRPAYSAELIRYALLLRHTSLQAYKLVQEKNPMPSISLLNKIQQGGVDSIKALQLLRDRGEVSKDCVMLVDEMYLEKGTQYSGGEYVGADNEGNLYKGVIVFMVVGLKDSIPYVIQAIPEVTYTGKWLAEKMLQNMNNLTQAGFCIRGIVTDNHSANVNAFSTLVKVFEFESEFYIRHPDNQEKKTYLFFDAPHLIKNIRNNLLNGKKLYFQNFFTMIICILISSVQLVTYVGVISTTYTTTTKT